MQVEFTWFGSPRHTQQGNLVFEARFRDLKDPDTANRKSVLLVAPWAAKPGGQPKPIGLTREHLKRRAQEWIRTPGASGTLEESRLIILQEVLKYEYGLMIGTLGTLSGIHESKQGLAAEGVSSIQEPDEILKAAASGALLQQSGLPALKNRDESLRRTRKSAALQKRSEAENAFSQSALFSPIEVDPELDTEASKEEGDS